MKSSAASILLMGSFFVAAPAQSGRVTGYSESGITKRVPLTQPLSPAALPEAAGNADGEVIRVATDLVTIPVRITTRLGKAVSNIKLHEFKIFENGIEQQIAYFSNDEQPFTVILLLDMSYSSVFKLEDIQTAARIFVSKLRDHDRVMVVSFDEKLHVLCEPTSDRRVLRLAIDGAKIASGTALYDTLESVVTGRLRAVGGRRAIVMLGDGVDTSSERTEPTVLERLFYAEDVIVYPIRYDTFDDVQKSRKKDAEIRFDENDRPIIVQAPRKKGEREHDYRFAESFLENLAFVTGGRVYPVTTTPSLNDAFASIADELRRIYSIGYYPSEDRRSGAVYDIKVRVYRPDLKITARSHYRGR